MLRKGLLGLALIATLIASVVDFTDTELVQPTQKESAAQTAGSAGDERVAARKPAEVAEQSALRERYAPQGVDLFSSHGWQRQHLITPTPMPRKPVMPKAPPLPFSYLGKMFDGEETLVFVSQGQRSHLLREGDVLEQYKVADISSEEITFVYTPLNEKQRLRFGKEN